MGFKLSFNEYIDLRISLAISRMLKKDRKLRSSLIHEKSRRYQKGFYRAVAFFDKDCEEIIARLHHNKNKSLDYE